MKIFASCFAGLAQGLNFAERKADVEKKKTSGTKPKKHAPAGSQAAVVKQPAQKAPRPSAEYLTDGTVPVQAVPARRRKAQTQQNITRKQIRKRQNRRRLAAVLVAAATVTIGFLLSVTVLFPIGGFRVEGESVYSQKELAAAFGHAVGENMFRFKIKNAEQSMAQKLPYLETIKVRRRLPGTVVFIVTPAGENFYFEKDGQYIILSNGLKGLRTDSAEPQNLCHIYAQGLSAAAGQPLGADDASTLSLFKTLLNQLNANGLAGFTKIDLTNPLEITLEYQGRITVKLGTGAQLDYKLSMVKAALTEKLSEQDKGILDASYAGKATFLAL